MKRSIKNSFFAILVLVSLIVSGIGVTPVYAANFMEIVPLSLPAGWPSGHLYSIWGSGASDVYAVGYGNNGNATLPLMFYNNGSSWSGSGLSVPDGWRSGYLFGVWGSSSSDVYAVGSGNNGSALLPLIYHKDASGWNVVSSPALPTGWRSGYLYGVWGSSASDVYAAGYGYNGDVLLPLLYHNNGSGWSDASPSVPNGWSSVNFRGIWSSGTSDVYVVGSGNNGSATLPLVYHKNDSWAASNLSVPNGWSNGYLYGIWGSSASDVYSVGYGNSGSTTLPLLYHNNGSGWSQTDLSLPNGWRTGYLYEVWGSSASDVYAIGSGNAGSALLPLLYYNNGSGWVEASPSLPAGWSFGYLQGVWGSSTSDVYAVGTGNNGSSNLPLLYHSSIGGPDLNAPGDVTEFTAVSGAVSGSVDLSWTAPRDDANDPTSGSVASYLVKYSTSPFTSWSDGIPVMTGIPAPTPPGTNQMMTISGLSPGTLYYFAIRAQDEQYNLSANYAMVSATAKITPVGAGIYDDTDPNWHYSSGWAIYTGIGPINNSLHYTTTAGNSAELFFHGTKFMLTFVKYSNRSSIDVYVDDKFVETINANAPSLAWQQTWTSPEYAEGDHKVRFVHSGSTGSYIDIDAIQIFGPVPAGTYDDTHAAWVYNGSWATYTGSGPYNNTLHYTTTTDDSAELLFHGTKFMLTFVKHSNRGSIDVYVDDKFVETINANAPSLAWQQTWTSPDYADGNHKVRFVHSGSTGSYIDIDAIQIFGARVAVPVGIYDDTDPNWLYSGSWATYTGSGPYNNTLHYTTTASNYAELLFHGTKFMLTFVKHSNRSSIAVYVDDQFVETINANSSSLQWQQTWTSPEYAEGDHKVRFVHSGSTGTYIDIDAIQIFGPVPAGTYDDTHAAWVYNGSWATYTGSGPYNNTLHYTTTTGNSAELLFHGTKFMLTFVKYSNRSSIDVYVDDKFVETINANAPSLAWQQTWTSPDYAEGDHKVRFVHSGSTGSYIDIDAIRIFGPVPAGTYDDTDPNWLYSGSWATYTGSGPYNNTLHYTTTTDDYAEFQFNGASFVLTFVKHSNRGSIDVYVDDIYVETIDANAPTLSWQQTYVSATYPPGNHKVRFVHSGSTGTYIDIDAIAVLP